MVMDVTVRAMLHGDIFFMFMPEQFKVHHARAALKTWRPICFAAPVKLKQLYKPQISSEKGRL
jgi:hypothetical protein